MSLSPKKFGRRNMPKTPGTSAGLLGLVLADRAGKTTGVMKAAMVGAVRAYIIDRKKIIDFRRAKRLLRKVSDDARLKVLGTESGDFLDAVKLPKGAELMNVGDKLRRKRLRTGGVQEARAFRLKDSSTVLELGGTLDESISVLRKSLNVKNPATGRIDKVVNAAKDFASSLGAATKRHWNGIVLDGYQRLHAWGHGFGDEARFAITYGSKEFNQAWQNKGIERSLRNVMQHVEGASIELKVRVKTFPQSTKQIDLPDDVRAVRQGQGEFVLEEMSYDFTIKIPGKPPMAGKVGLRTSAPGEPLVILPDPDEFVDPDLVALFEEVNKIDVDGQPVQLKLPDI